MLAEGLEELALRGRRLLFDQGVWSVGDLDEFRWGSEGVDFTGEVGFDFIVAEDGGHAVVDGFDS